MKYCSTRGGKTDASFTDVLMDGLAPDGGLYVPQVWPVLSGLQKGMSYIETAQNVLGSFVAGTMDDRNLRTLITDTYTPRTDGFDVREITPLKRLDDRLSVLELFHGPTIAFKDVALQMLGRFFDAELKRTGQKMTVLGATSGDTGSAAIEGCRHADGARIFILYPHNRPSDVQRLQMTTVADPHVNVIAIEGNFDDCQSIVKTLFNDPAFRAGQNLSAVNSINWARIAAQAVYYVHTCLQFEAPVNFVVPTGNFGNVYAAYVARQMGAPINRLVVASNRNDILTRFFETGTMKAGQVEPSLSPSMDIQVSSNFERLLFDLLDRDSTALTHTMAELKAGSFTLPPHVMANLAKTFSGMRCDDDETLAAIASAKRAYDYVIDPHTAVGFHSYEQLKDSLEGHTVALACAHPAKFPQAVQKAIGERPALPEKLADLYERKERFTVLPNDAAAVKAFIEKMP